MDGPAAPHAPHTEAPDDQAPISRIVAEVAAQFPGERLTIGDMADAFGDRAFGLLILLLSIPALLPGMASVFGIPVLVLGVQLGLGWGEPRLPGFIARQGLKRTELLRFASISARGLSRIERLVRPRPGWSTGPFGRRVIGWLTVYAALMLILPGPGTNGPPGIGTIIMALGLVEHDGKVAALGMAITLAGCLFATGVLAALFWFGAQALDWLL